LLVERGWITPTDRADVGRLLERKIKKHGDARASLAVLTDQNVRSSLAAIDDAGVRQTITGIAGEAPVSVQIPAVELTRERYTLTRIHATGGIGRVWLAYDTHLGREVALKELRSDKSHHAELASLFLREARITGQLEHPGIVPVYELAQ